MFLIFENLPCAQLCKMAIIHDQVLAFMNALPSEMSKMLRIYNYENGCYESKSNSISKAKVKIVLVVLSKMVNEKKGN